MFRRCATPFSLLHRDDVPAALSPRLWRKAADRIAGLFGVGGAPYLKRNASAVRESPQLSRLIMVSNRVPAGRGRDGSQGGLAVALLSSLHQQGGVWLGWNGQIDDDEAGHIGEEKTGNVSLVTFALSEADYQDYYAGFSNSVLWPLFHQRLNLLNYERPQREAYRRVNTLFARHVKPLLEPGCRVWVHDYHLFPLAQCLREMGVKVPIGFFLHIPFPPWDLLRALPDYEQLLAFLTHYDLVGLQTAIDLHNFRECMIQGLGARPTRDSSCLTVEGRRIKAGAFPISIDVEETQRAASIGAQSKPGKRFVQSLRSDSLIIGVDRLDYSKGLHERFRAFERLLEKHTSYHGRVNFVQVAPHSRSDVPEYAEMQKTLERAVGHVNGRFAQHDWTPLRYINRAYDRYSILGFLRVAKVALVTPLRDGMNLVAKEFVAAQDPEDPGVLVLSNLAGASQELDGALVCHPCDIDGIAQRLHEALSMSRAERRLRWEQMMTVLDNNDIHHWTHRFLNALS